MHRHLDDDNSLVDKTLVDKTLMINLDENYN